ncbi:MAG: hypothetical protein Q9201_007736 [Fulgogasparrea decipioides]
MVATTRSQDHEHASSATKSKASQDIDLPIRSSDNGKRPDELRATTASGSGTRKRKLQDLLNSSEAAPRKTLAAVVIPKSTSEAANQLDKGSKEEMEKPESRTLNRETGHLAPSSGEARPPVRELGPTSETATGGQRIREHIRPWTPASNDKPAINKRQILSSFPVSTPSPRGKAKKSRQRDPRMDVSSLVDAQHRTPQVETEVETQVEPSNSTHKRFESEGIESVPLPTQPDRPAHEALEAPRSSEDVATTPSDDEAPEVVTQSRGLENARSAAAEAAKAAGAQRRAEKQKRRERDRVLKAQAIPSKKQPKELDTIVIQPGITPDDDDDVPEQIPPPPLDSPDQMDWSAKGVLPELLPEEILAAEPMPRLPTPIPQLSIVKVTANKKRRFIEKTTKPPKDIQKGNVRIRVLEDTKTVLPPKVAKSSQMIRESWLAGRRGHKGKVMMERRTVGGGFVRK